MRDFDWDAVRRGKERHRSQVAAHTFEQKLAELEQLRARTSALSGRWIPLRDKPSSNSHVLVAGPDEYPNSGATNLGMFGANVSLVAPAAGIATRVLSSAATNASVGTAGTATSAD